MVDTSQITRDMEVVDTNGHHIGKVDHVQGDIVELSRSGFADGLHHFVPLAAVKEVHENRVLVDPGKATTVEAVAAAVNYARSHPAFGRRDPLFGTSGHGTGMGGSGIGD